MLALDFKIDVFIEMKGERKSKCSLLIRMFFKKLLLIAFAKGNGGYPIAAIFYVSKM